jgi:Putative zinc-finger
MECKKFELSPSAYIDRQLQDVELADYRAHLSTCSDCRIRLSELEQVSLMFRDVEQPEVPRELHGYVMTEAARRSSREIDVRQRLVEWLLKLNPRLVAYTTGVTMSALSFLLLFSSFRPIPVSTIVDTEQAAIFPVISGSDREFHSYNDLPQDTDSPGSGSDHYYQLPRVLDHGALVSFSHIAYQKPGDEGMSAMVEVESDGSARLVNVLDAPKDPYLIEQLWWSLRNRTFQPATVSGRPVSTRIILLVEKMDVSG